MAIVGVRVGKRVDRDDVGLQLGERLFVVREALAPWRARRAASCRRCGACRRRPPRSPGCAYRRARGSCPCCRARRTRTRFFAIVSSPDPQRSSSVSSRAITILPAVSPQSTGSATPVIADAASEARKADRLRYLDRLDDPAERIPACASSSWTSGIARHALVPDRRPHRAGADDVGADAVAAELQRQRPGQADHAGLGGAVGGVAERGEAVDRADVDDRAGFLAFMPGSTA